MRLLDGSEGQSGVVDETAQPTCAGIEREADEPSFFGGSEEGEVVQIKR